MQTESLLEGPMEEKTKKPTTWMCQICGGVVTETIERNERDIPVITGARCGNCGRNWLPMEKEVELQDNDTDRSGTLMD